MSANTAVPYRIDFENDAKATAPSQSVTITDHLAANFDWSTFALTEIGWGDTILIVPPRTQHYQNAVRVTIGGKTFNVLVEAGINSTTGQVYATFQSLDLDSQLPPDVLTGFLPPEDGTGRGMGHIGYTIRAKSGLATGTEIRNVALIVFDGQTAISTDQVDPHDPTKGVDPDKQARITIDAEAPVASVLPLPATSSTPTFTVEWSGTDPNGGSGVASYDLFVSKDGGPFTAWLTNTVDTSAQFTGANGKTYRFYAVAVDHVGLRQPIPASAQATIIVDSSSPTSSVAALPELSPGRFTVSWSGSDHDGIAYYDIFVSDNGGSFVPWLTKTTQASETFVGQDGHIYGFYSVATDNVGNAEPSPNSAQATTMVDDVAPTSSVGALPALSPRRFPISWSGSDNKEIAYYDVFVSDNGGSFSLWLTATTQTSGTFVGEDGHTYGFYSVATDKVGNVQASPSAAQATTVIDATAPTSSIGTLPELSPGHFTISWSGSDTNGIAYFDIFVSDNGGSFEPWLTATKQTSATFAGQDGHTYGFYSVATDKVGNVQASPSAAQATTVIDATAPTSSMGTLPELSPGHFTISWSGSDTNGIAYFDIFISDNGGSFEPWLTATKQTSATFAGQDGHTYGFYAIATDKVGNVQPSPSAAQAITVVDAMAPASSVETLPELSPGRFTITWSGSDNKGIASYDVLVSDNGGAFVPWLKATTKASEIYEGLDGHTYAFYSIATDKVGNVQSSPVTAQATTFVDAVAPSSTVGALPELSPSRFTVSWSGSDNKGIASYDVLVSDNGGAFAPWLKATTQTSDVYEGLDGHTYAFYSIAMDNVGNVQPSPVTAQASTLVDAVAPTSSVDTLPELSPGRFPISWSGSDNKGIATYDVLVSDNGGAFVRWLTATKQTSDVYEGLDGHTYAFYSIATDKVGNVQPSPVTAQASTLVDAVAPTSSIDTLPALSPGRFPISWSGSDNKGIVSYDVLVSDNGGAFVRWLTATTQTSDVYEGLDGHTYTFYSIATDKVGNVQPSPVAAQASTLVDAAAPTSFVGTLPALSPGRFTVSWSGSDNNGIAIYDVLVSDNGGPFVTWLTATTKTSEMFTGKDGHTYGFYSIATDWVGNLQSTPSDAQSQTTVDASAPSSTMLALPAFSLGTFALSWSGADNAGGSGLASFSIFVSDNGGPFKPFKINTNLTSAVFTGVDGHSYGFYSIATDQVGNLEAVPSSAQTNSTVDTSVPTSSVSALPAFSPGTFTLSWAGSDKAGGSGLASYSVFVSDNGGAFKPFKTNTNLTSAVFTGVDGHIYGFYSLATDQIGNVQSTPIGAQTKSTIDSSAPTSNVSALPTFGPGTFTLSWAGMDKAGGSGLASYSIFVSDNGGPFKPFKTNTNLTSSAFTGVDGHTYGFYSVATDKIGNTQATPVAVQAKITVDTTAPTGAVTALPAFSPGTFTISWAGADKAGGSGVANYSVFVSDNGGAFKPFRTNTTLSSAAFTGLDGHTYSFYSIATDKTGNVQSVPTAAQAKTTVDTSGPSSTVSLLPTYSSGTFTVSWAGADKAGGSGLASYSVFVSDNGGAFKPFKTNTTLMSAAFTGVDGHTYSFYSIATDKTGNVQPVPTAAQAKTTVDTASPTSTMSALSAFSPGTFTVSWTGADKTGGSGLASYSVFVSDNGGAFKPFKTNTNLTSAAFTGVDGHTYIFYSIATDKIGNMQAAPLSAQAKTIVDTSAPNSTVSLLPAFSSGAFALSWSGADQAGGSGLASYSVFVSENGGAFKPFKINTTSTSATFTGVDGHVYLFYSVATDNVGNVQTTPGAAQAASRVDDVAPTSTINPLPAYSFLPFVVSWSGTDSEGGTGIASYSVFVKDNSGPFVAYLINTTENSTTFTGVPGHTYSFYSSAIDRVGNSQTTQLNPQVITVAPLADRLTIGVPEQTIAGGAFRVTVSATNSMGLTDPTYQGTIALALSSGVNGAKLAGTTMAIAQNGVATFTGLSLNKVGGGYKLRAATNDDLTAAVSSAITVVSTTHFKVSTVPANATVTAGGTVTLVVTALDASNRPDGNYKGVIHFTSSDLKAVLLPDTAFVGKNGVATFQVSAITAGSQTFTVSDSTLASAKGISAAVKVNALTVASGLKVTGFPSASVSGKASSFKVTAVDRYDNTVVGYSGTVSFASGSNPAVLPQAYVFKPATDKGSHIFSVTFNTPGTYSLTVTDQKNKLTGSESDIHVVSSATQLSLSGMPANLKAGQAFTLTVTALDALSKVDLQFGDTIHFSSTDSKAVLPADYTFQASDKGKRTFTLISKFATMGTQSIIVADITRSSVKSAKSSSKVSGQLVASQ